LAALTGRAQYGAAAPPEQNFYGIIARCQPAHWNAFTDKDEVLGPYESPDASKPHRFDIDVTAKSLRLDVVSSNGGNVGLVEFAAYAAQ
jgi:hypothetical protein